MRAFIFLFFICFSVLAQNLPKEISLKGITSQRIGQARLEYYFWDVYDIGYYKGHKTETIRLEYLRDVKKSISIEGWETSLKEFKSIDLELNWLRSVSTNMKKGDKLDIVKKEPSHISFYKNNELLKKIDSVTLYKLVHYPWIGAKPIDEAIKKKLVSSSTH